MVGSSVGISVGFTVFPCYVTVFGPSRWFDGWLCGRCGGWLRDFRLVYLWDLRFFRATLRFLGQAVGLMVGSAVGVVVGCGTLGHHVGLSVGL